VGLTYTLDQARLLIGSKLRMRREVDEVEHGLEGMSAAMVSQDLHGGIGPVRQDLPLQVTRLPDQLTPARARLGLKAHWHDVQE
jgi:hypothetical protein